MNSAWSATATTTNSNQSNRVFNEIYADRSTSLQEIEREVQARQEERHQALARVMQVGYPSRPSNHALSAQPQQTQPFQIHIPINMDSIQSGPTLNSTDGQWSSSILNQASRNRQSPVTPVQQGSATPQIIQGVTIPDIYAHASTNRKMQFVESVLAHRHRTNLNRRGHHIPNSEVQDKQPGPSRAQQQSNQSPPTVNSAQPRVNQSREQNDVAQVFRRLLPVNFQARPRFVPGQVIHYSDRFDAMAAVPVNVSTNSHLMNGDHSGIESLKVSIDSTPPAEVFRHAGAGIGRLVGLLPATDLLDREAHTFQTALIAVANLTEEANTRANVAESRLAEQEKKIKALQEDVASMKKQMSRISTDLSDTSSAVLTFREAMEVHRYILEASKRDKRLGEKIADYDRILGVNGRARSTSVGFPPNDQRLTPSSERATGVTEYSETGQQVTTEPAVPSKDSSANLSFVSTTGQAGEAGVDQVAQVSSNQAITRSGEGGQIIHSQPLDSIQQKERRRPTLSGALNHQLSAKQSVERTSSNGSLLEQTVRSLEQPNGEDDGDDYDSGDSDRQQDSANTNAIESQKVKDLVEQVNSEAREDERQASPEADFIKFENERDELESEVGTLLGDGKSDAANEKEGAAATIEKTNEVLRSDDTPAPNISVDAAPALAQTSPEQSKKRKRDLETTSYIHKGSRYESIVISDEDSDYD